MQIETIRKQTARRYVLGRQGLWPGRRWQGQEGTADALLQAESVQVDTISVVARSQDLALHSRVQDYRPEHLDILLYQERRFFDYGWILFVYPMQELPYWQTVMQQQQQRRSTHSEAFQALCDHVREEIKARGPLGNRDFTDRKRVPGGYNMVKDTAHALGHLWISGDLMTHSRKGFDRMHDLFENVTGRPFETICATLEDAERFFFLKAMRDLGLATPAEWARRVSVLLHRRMNARQAQTHLDALTAEGALTKICIEGRKEVCYLPAVDLPLLNLLEADKQPAAWKPLDTDTHQEVCFLAPLDNVIWDRARTQALFDFEYIWEVYKPQAQRRWGYYTLPILYGDRLVGRLDPKLDRKTRTLTLQGFWLEDDALAEDTDFTRALESGLSRFLRFHDADRLDASAIPFPALRQSLQQTLP